ncbi:MAG TPA: OmpA family protein [Flavobacterium sp.]|jgi:hypothetical protein
MKLTPLLYVLFLLFAIGSHAQKTQELQIFFQAGSSEVTLAEAAKINTLKTVLLPTRKYLIEITGHTDIVGNLAYNKSLSMARANTVAALIRSRKFTQKPRIITSAKAFTKPIAINTTDAGKAKNRRVSIKIIPLPYEVAQIGGYRPDDNNVTIDNNSDQTIDYKSGTKIRIPANAFVDENGTPIAGKIDIKYVEYRDPIDFILGNISMTIDGREDLYFDSGGMFKILAFQSGEPIFLNPEKEITIDFALTSDMPELNFYKYDSINKTWSELSNLPASERQRTDEQELDYLPGVTKYVDAICNQGPCINTDETRSYGLTLAKLANSLLKDYQQEKTYSDSIALARHLYYDSIAKQKFNEKLERTPEIRKLRVRITRNQTLINRLTKYRNNTVGFQRTNNGGQAAFSKKAGKTRAA